MNHRRVAIRLVLVALLSVFFLTGCAKHPKADSYDTPAGSFKNTKACKANEFLQRYDCSLDRVEQAAENNDPDAMYALGYMYYYGLGTVRDQETAIVWIKRAAGQNQPLAIQAMKMIRKKQFSHTGQVTMAMNATKKTIPNTDPTPKRVRSPYIQQFTKKAQPKSGPQVHPVHMAKAPMPAAQIHAAKVAAAKPATAQPVIKHVMHEPVASGNHSSNWAGADVPVSGVVASHATDKSDQSKKHYTLQIMAAHHIDIIKQFLSNNELGKQASYYHTYYQNKNWYVLIYGDYPSVKLAKQAIPSLPLNVQRMHPWVKSYRTVQKEILEKSVI